MQISRKGLIELAGHEGICLKPYLDSVGVWTIGIGATKSEIPGLNGSHKEITLQEAIDLYKKSIVKYTDAITKALKVPVSQEQFDALASICYNIGTSGLSKSTFLKRINARGTLRSILDGIMMWKIPREIILRRSKEALLYELGTYSNKGKAMVFPVRTSAQPNYSKGISVDLNKLL